MLEKKAEIQFGIDNTAPVIASLNLENGIVYNESIKEALFSIAADVQTVTKLNPQMQQDPVVNGIKVASASISEANNNLILQAEIEATSPDAANMLHAQINALIATLKNDPANKALADMMKLNVKGNNVEFKGVFPVDFVINAIKSTLANIPQQNVPGAAPVPAVPAAK